MGGQRASRLRTFCGGVGLNVLGFALLGTSAAAGAQVYVQPYDLSGFAVASQNDVTSIGDYAAAFDNFALSSDVTIAGLSFTGIYYNFSPGDIAMTTSFQVQIYGDDSGQPDGFLYSTTIIGNGGELCDAGPGNLLCTYKVPLNFAAVGGATYWLSIVSNSEVTPQWGWASGSGGDGGDFQIFFGDGTHERGDLAFSLFAPEVPEPSSWAMMLLGLGALGTTLRRSRARSTTALPAR